jgi:hypothetical protein
VNRLAATALVHADIVRSLAMRLHSDLTGPDHIIEVLAAFDNARQAFTEACGAAQAATAALRRNTRLPR